MGFPASDTSGFPGSRIEPYLAGITTTTLAKLSSYHARFKRNKNSLLTVYKFAGRFLVWRCYHRPPVPSGPSNCSIVNIKQLLLFSGSRVIESRLVPTARPSRQGRDDGGAVKRDIPGFRVLPFTFQLLLVVCLFVFQAVPPASAQSATDENKPKNDAKREELKEVKKDDVRKDSAGVPFKPDGTIHFDVA